MAAKEMIQSNKIIVVVIKKGCWFWNRSAIVSFCKTDSLVKSGVRKNFGCVNIVKSYLTRIVKMIKDIIEIVELIIPFSKKYVLKSWTTRHGPNEAIIDPSILNRPNFRW